MKHYCFLLLSFSAIGLLTGVNDSWATIRRVPSEYLTIQLAIDAAAAGDTVLVAEGLYYENILIQSKSIVVASDYIVDGDTSHISRTIIDGSRPLNTNRGTVITITDCKDTTTVICGLTITRGFGTAFPNGVGGYQRVAAGLNVEGSSALITHNNVVRNVISPTVVPGVYVEATAAGIGANTHDVDSTVLVVRNNLIAENRVEAWFSSGAGITYLSEEVTASFIIEHNTIRDNVTRDLGTWKGMGGGLVISVIFPTSGTKVIRNNLIAGNKVLGYRSFGGGVYFVYEDSPGGILDNDIGELFYNNILDGNHAEYRGGAVSLWRHVRSPGTVQSWGKYRPRPVFINNTIVNNTAGDGSGFFIMNHVPFLMNNILWDEPQDSAEWGEAFFGDVSEWRDPNRYGGWEVRSSDIRGGWGGDTLGNIDSDPLLDSTYRLSNISPCIGAGIDSFEVSNTWHHAPPFCFYGGARPYPKGSRPDLGACESPVFVAVDEPPPGSPSAFTLSQNFPNPFNPSTTIRYGLSERSHVTLTVFNTLGQRVAALVDGEMEARDHEVKFDASHLSSGVYLYRLQAGYRIEVRKALLMK